MASLPLPTSTTTTRNPFSFTQPPQFSIYRNIAPKFISCKATNITSITNNNEPQNNNAPIDRRNMLVSTLTTFSGVATALTTAVVPPSLAVSFPKPLDSVIRTTLSRPRKSRTAAEKAVEEELVVVDVEVSHAKARMSAFEVYINYNGDESKLQEKTQRFDKGFAGSFSALRHSPHHKGKMVSGVRLGLNRIIEDLGIDGDENLEVTLVPRSGLDSIVINDVRIEYLKN